MNSHHRRLPLACVAGAMLALLAPSFPARASDDEPSAERMARVADAVAPSLVRVEYTLKYDKGDAPGAGGQAAWMRSIMGASREDGLDTADLEELIREERPLAHAGFLLPDGRVVTADLRLHPRFVGAITIRSGDKAQPATIDAYARSQDAVFLRPAGPITGAKPLGFDAKAPGPYCAVNYVLRSGAWTIGVGPAPSTARTEEGSTRRYTPAPKDLLIVDSAGKGVGMSFTGELAIEGAWRGSPADWPSLKQDEMDRALADLDKSSGPGLPRVAVRFRSPRQGSGEASRFRGGYSPDETEAATTEWNGSGVLVSPSTVVVLASFKPKVTARLESIQVFGSDGKPVNAKFAGTLKDYDGFVATLSVPIGGQANLASGPIAAARDQLLLKAEVSVLGESRTAYLWHDRVDSLALGWKNRLYPAVESGRSSGRPWENDAVQADDFLFDLSGALVALPLAHRERITSSQDRFSLRGRPDAMLPSAYLKDVLAEGAGAYDPENRPLSEEEENRLAWLGVELQAMNPDLARINKVVDQTGGGRTGAVVTYIYPSSPAADAGLEVGDILLRLHVQGQPKPLDVDIEGGDEGIFERYWAQYDRIPDEYFDRLPQPWGSASNSLTRALTDLGFGTPFTADLSRDGKLLTKQMKVTQGPAYYDSAKRFKSEAGGLTVRDLTYEARRYFQLTPEDPGVIISKIEKGGRAAVAGLKPFEIVTSVDDAPIRNVGDFEKAIAKGGELRLAVKRMTEGRIVKLKIGGAPRDEKAGAEAGDAAPAKGGAPK